MPLAATLMPTLIPHQQITGLVLAGGRGSRMGGVDKGLQLHHGVPLAQHAMQRLAAQVGTVMVNANRNLEVYQAMGVPVWPDALSDYPGPLAGVLAGLEHCPTPWLVTVPCDTPNFPLDLVARLAQAASGHDAEVVVAECLEDGQIRTQPVFCLLRRTLAADLRAFLLEGGRKVDRWTGRRRGVTVRFDDAAAFFNANTLEELQKLQG